MKIFYLLLVTIFLLSSCKKDIAKERAEQMVKEWIDKTIVFPVDVPCSYLGKDTVCPDILKTDYKILLFVDSLGCTSCKLKLGSWNKLMKENRDSLGGKVDFLIYFQPKSVKELNYLLKSEELDRIVFVDVENKLNSLNKFPAESNFQCFLLDRENKVVAIGNPVYNPAVWKLYKQIITGKRQEKSEEKIEKKAKVEIKQKEKSIENLKANNKTQISFALKNIGDIPLIISHVDASCGCTVPDWDKTPAKPGETTEVHVAITPDKPGFFSKTIDVYCNTPDSPVRLTIKGEAKE